MVKKTKSNAVKKTPDPHANKPFVAAITPTYGRHKFLPWLIRMFNGQTYPQSRMCLIILDDSPEEIQDENLLKMLQQPNIKFVRHTESKLTIGAKRNKLNELAIEAGADIIVAFDDDDFYPTDRVEHSVTTLTRTGAQISGSSIMYIYFADDKIIKKFGPYGGDVKTTRHATNGTFAYTKQYAQTHKYDEIVAYGEESSFTHNFSEPLVQMDPFKAILCISHMSNTFDKKMIKQGGAATVAKLKDFVKDKEIREFYQNLYENQMKDPKFIPGTQHYVPIKMELGN